MYDYVVLISILIRSIIIGVVSFFLLFFLKQQNYSQDNRFDVVTNIILKSIDNIEFFSISIAMVYFTLSMIFFYKEKQRR